MQRRWKKPLILTIVLAGLLLALWFIPFTGDAVRNSLHLWQLERQLKSLQQPSGTARVAFRSDVGLLVGNGNHCDFFVGELRSYSGPRAAIEQHYRDLRVFNPVTQKNETIDVIFVDDWKIPGAHLPDEFDQISGWGVEQSEGSPHMYSIYVFRSYEANWDFRCW
jgi:hypothetical protein